jgi:hypothetical protein
MLLGRAHERDEKTTNAQREYPAEESFLLFSSSQNHVPKA